MKARASPLTSSRVMCPTPCAITFACSVVLRRPTEQAKVIAHGVGHITLLDVSGDARAFIALAHLRPIVIQNERDVRKTRWRRAKRAIKLDMLGRVGKVVFTANNV